MRYSTVKLKSVNSRPKSSPVRSNAVFTICSVFSAISKAVFTFDGCKRVNQLEICRGGITYTKICYSSTRSHPSETENRGRNCIRNCKCRTTIGICFFYPLFNVNVFSFLFSNLRTVHSILPHHIHPESRF